MTRFVLDMLDFIANIDPLTFWLCSIPVLIGLSVACLWLICRACDRDMPDYPKKPACNYRNCIAGSCLGDGRQCIMRGGEPWNDRCPAFEPGVGE